VGTQQRSTGSASYGRDTVEFARAFTFFDAVYAFALTLLAVNLDPPRPRDWTSLSKLLASGLEWQFFGFIVSFVVIAVFWRVNHRIVAGFRALSQGTIVANLVAIAFVVLIPFSTQGVSDEGTADQPLAVAIYAGEHQRRRARPGGHVLRRAPRRACSPTRCRGAPTG
jgi:uncharacterized membrane protein